MYVTIIPVKEHLDHSFKVYYVDERNLHLNLQCLAQ